jgi:hypothetical protein
VPTWNDFPSLLNRKTGHRVHRALGTNPRLSRRANRTHTKFRLRVRSAEETCSESPDAKMLELAPHIIKKKAGRFAGRAREGQDGGPQDHASQAPEPTRPSDLMEALRQNVAEDAGLAMRSARPQRGKLPDRRPRSAASRLAELGFTVPVGTSRGDFRARSGGTANSYRDRAAKDCH